MKRIMSRLLAEIMVIFTSMKVFAISDLHLSTTVNKPMDIFGPQWKDHFDVIKQDWISKVSDQDLVLMAGDFSWAMRSNEVISDFALFEGLPGKKIILRGNHDYWWNTISRVREFIPQGFYALQNNAYRFDNILLFGTRGWTCPESTLDSMSKEDKKIYLCEIERFKLSIADMKKQRQDGDKVICMFHFPPFNSRIEPSDFVRMLIENDVHTVVYGHLHGKDSRISLLLNKFGINFYLTSCDLVENKLVEIV